jgi:hypothetical protein
MPSGLPVHVPTGFGRDAAQRRIGLQTAPRRGPAFLDPSDLSVETKKQVARDE